MLTKNLAETAKHEDSFLLEGIKQGSKHSFNLLYERHWEEAYRSAFKRLKDSEQAKDIVQDIFTYIWVKRENLQIDNFPAYLHVAVRNRVIKFAGSQKVSHPFFKVLENIPEMQMNSDANILTKEFFQAYEAVLNSLPAKKQVIFRLRFHENLSTKDIATHLRLSRKTVQNQLGKAIEQLRITFFLLLVVLLTLFSL